MMSKRDSHYKYHVFFCQNKRIDGRENCADKNALLMLDYAKKRINQLNLSSKRSIRINKSGCLNRCCMGPCVVVYPDAVWYTYVDSQDIDEIFDSHLIEGKRVDRLCIDVPDTGKVQQ